jgi:O-acetyl-ADP-ribose deacetylase (regulator of RNase III)
VSAGIYGWPKESAAEIAVRVMRETETAVTEVTFCLVEPRLYQAFSKALGR